MRAHTVTAAVSAVAAAMASAIVIPAVLLGGSNVDAASAGTVQQAALTAGSCEFTPTSGGGARAAGLSLSAAQLQIAHIAATVVIQRSLPGQALIDVLAAGYQESRLTNLDSGDRDSVGYLQQRPSQGWGTVAELEDPEYATGAFLDRLISVADWISISPAQAIQDVQVSSDGSLYAQWVPMASALAAAMLGAASSGLSCSGGGGTADAPPQAPNATVAAVLARARTALTLPYCFDGGDANGPTHGDGGSGCGGTTVGFDCSGLALFAWAGVGVALPHSAAAQYQAAGTLVPISAVQPGDLVFLSSDGSVPGIHHVAIIWSITGRPDGSGQIIEAQDFNVPVHVRAWSGTAEAEVMPYALRLVPS
jgi:peptidoglycan DL-endopeptidase CwlO